MARLMQFALIEEWLARFDAGLMTEGQLARALAAYVALWQGETTVQGSEVAS